MSKRSKYVKTASVLMAGFLAGCGGEDAPSSGSSTGGSGPQLVETGSAILLASFLDSLDSVRSRATQLLSNDARYRLQTAPSGRYVDHNRNGRYDSGADVRLVGNPIEHAGIHYAHAAGLTGAGQTIAFSDSGFRVGHDAFDAASVSTGTGLDTEDHGTFVASIAAGNSDDMIGVAPGADLIFGSFDSLSQLAETANMARTANAVALNNSWGYSGMHINSADYNTIFGSSAGANYLAALRNYARDGVVVFAASNDHTETSAGLLAALPQLEPSLEQSWLAVVNGVPVVSGDDVVSAERVSSACLEAAAWCIAANGSWTGATASSDSSYSFGTGTSYAAPTVSGALALLAEAFPTMTNQELRIRLLASADNDFTGFSQDGTVELVPGFEHAYSEEWGHGFLDVAAALLPIGRPTITTANGTVLDADQPLAIAGAASGDAVARALSSVELVSQDALSASFVIDASQMIAQRPAAPMFQPADAVNIGRDQETSFGAATFFGEGPGIPLQISDAAYDVSLFRARSGGSDRFGLGLRRSFNLGRASLHLGGAVGQDTLGLLSDWNGGTDASLMSMDVGLTAPISDNTQLRFAMGYALGQEDSALGQSADLLLNGGALTFAQRHTLSHNDRFSVSLAMPAAVTSGTTSVALPVTNSLGGVSYDSVPIDLAPSDREVRLTLSYERPFSEHSSWGVSLAHAINRGHIPGARETAVMFGLRTRF